MWLERFRRQKHEEIPAWAVQVKQSYAALFHQIDIKEENAPSASIEEKEILLDQVHSRLKNLIETVRPSNQPMPDKFFLRYGGEFSELYFFTSDAGLRDVPLVPVHMINRLDFENAVPVDTRKWCSDSVLVKEVARGSMSYLSSGIQARIHSEVQSQQPELRPS